MTRHAPRADARRRAGWPCRAAACAAALLAVPALPARASDWYTGPSAGAARPVSQPAKASGPAGASAATAAAPADDLVVAANASISVTSTRSIFLNAGATAAVASRPDASGLRVRVEAMAGRYDYPSGATGRTIRADQAELSVMGGYEWVWRNARLAALIGVSAGNVQLSAPDPTNPSTGLSAGLKVAADLWMQPTDATMFSVYGAYTTSANTYYLRTKFGVSVFDRFYIGPEAALLGNDFYGQWRLGAHLSGLRLGRFDLSLAGGYLQDQGQKAGAYATIDMRSDF